MKTTYFRYALSIGMLFIVLSLLFPWFTTVQDPTNEKQITVDWFPWGYRYHQQDYTEELTLKIYFIDPASPINLTKYGLTYLVIVVIFLILSVLILAVSSIIVYPNKVSVILSIATVILSITAFILFFIGINDSTTHLREIIEPTISQGTLTSSYFYGIYLYIIGTLFIILAPLLHSFFRDRISALAEEKEKKEGKIQNSKKQKKNKEKGRSKVESAKIISIVILVLAILAAVWTGDYMILLFGIIFSAIIYLPIILEEKTQKRKINEQPNKREKIEETDTNQKDRYRKDIKAIGITIVVIIIVVLAVFVGMTIINNNNIENIFTPNSKFIGTWRLVEGPGTFSTIILQGNNKAMLQPGSYSTTWEINNGRLVFHLDISPVYTPTYDYEFRDSNTLILALVGHNIPVTYVRN